MADYPKASPSAGGKNVQDNLTRMAPAAADVRLGDVVNDLVSRASALMTNFNALLAHIDTGNVAGIGNTNVANFAVTPGALTPINARSRSV